LRKKPRHPPVSRIINIFQLIKNDKYITIAEMAKQLHVSEKKKDINKLKDENRNRRVGSAKSGY
jgi:DeoR/GlpR family transcriptional regulator of sugar metabolism